MLFILASENIKTRSRSDSVFQKIPLISLQGFCKECKHFSIKNIQTGIYRLNQQTVPCDLCKMIQPAEYIYMDKSAFANVTHGNFYLKNIHFFGEIHQRLGTVLNGYTRPNILLSDFSRGSEVIPIDCALCFKEITAYSSHAKIFYYICDHRMCKECAQSWLDDKCPICREILFC